MGRRTRATKDPEWIRGRVLNDLKQWADELRECLEDTFTFERSGRQGEEGDRTHRKKVKALEVEQGEGYCRRKGEESCHLAEVARSLKKRVKLEDDREEAYARRRSLSECRSRG